MNTRFIWRVLAALMVVFFVIALYAVIAYEGARSWRAVVLFAFAIVWLIYYIIVGRAIGGGLAKGDGKPGRSNGPLSETDANQKNIQVIDGAENCVYDIFAATDEDFFLIFPTNQNVAFIEEVVARAEGRALDAAFARIWDCPVRKSEVCGIHGILFYGLEEKKAYYPTRRDEEAVNPDGTRLR